MVHVEDFRKLSLYQKSLDLCYAVYRFIDKNAEELSDQEKLKIRKIAVRISAVIAGGIGQTNMKIRFKSLNKAKGLLMELEVLMSKLVRVTEIKQTEYRGLQDYYDQLIRLMNAYFSWMSKKRIKISN
jgi:four helix bundle protein